MIGDGKIEPGRTAWFYDANFDGRFDSAQHIAKGKATKIPVKNGRFDTRSPLTSFQKIRNGALFENLFDQIAGDISGRL